MNTKTQAQIYLADQRGYSETNDFRSYQTFNFGSYLAEGRQPFESLCLLNDDMLRAGTSLSMEVDRQTKVILLPVAGGLSYTVSHDSSAEEFLEPGQVGMLSLDAGMHFVVSNPYETESINFLQLWLTDSSRNTSAEIYRGQFDLSTRNTLLPLTDTLNSRLVIGQYNGRQEGEYSTPSIPTANTKGLFVFVLQGSFEVADRLLQERDGLAIQTGHEYVLEFEALSRNAILILIEFLS